MAKTTKETANVVRDAIEAFVKSSEDNYYAPEKRRKAVSRPYHELAGDRLLPMSIHRALATREHKGTLYNLLMEDRFSWEELKALYDRLGGTEEAKVRLLRNKDAPVDFIKEMQSDPSVKVSEVLFGSPKMPVSEFEALAARFAEVGAEMQRLFPDASPYTGRSLSPRWEELRQLRHRMDTSAGKWCARHENPVAVIEAVNRVSATHPKFPLWGVSHEAAKREDVTWEMVKAHSPNLTSGVAHSYISQMCHKIPDQDRAAIVAGRLKTKTYARFRCMESSNGKFKPRKLNRLIKMYNTMLEQQGEADFVNGVKDSFMVYSKYWKGVPKFSTSPDSPAEALILEKFEPTVAANMGIVSFPHLIAEIRKDAKKVARALELRDKTDEKSREEYRSLSGRLLGPLGRTPQMAERALRGILETEEGNRAWQEWLRSSEFAELADVPYEWALEVLI